MSGATGALAFSSALTLISAYGKSQAQRAAGALEAEQMDAAGRLNQLRARDAIERGVSAETDLAAEQRLRRGQTVAAFAGQGVDPRTGSAFAVRQSQERLSQEERLRVRMSALREAWGLRQQARRQRTGAKFARLASESEAAQTLLTGGLQVARAGMLFRPRLTIADQLKRDRLRQLGSADVGAIDREIMFPLPDTGPGFSALGVD